MEELVNLQAVSCNIFLFGNFKMTFGLPERGENSTPTFYLAPNF